jgi:hypothetical protein
MEHSNNIPRAERLSAREHLVNLCSYLAGRFALEGARSPWERSDWVPGRLPPGPWEKKSEANTADVTVAEIEIYANEPRFEE